MLEREYCLKVILRGDLVLAFVATDNTAVENLPALTKGFDTNRFHQATTTSRPIPGMDINVLTVQTARAMIGKSIARDNARAMGTVKILSAFLKMLGRERYIHIHIYIH